VDVVGLYVQSGMYPKERRDLLDVAVYTCPGPAAGRELDASAWTPAGRAAGVRLATARLTAGGGSGGEEEAAGGGPRGPVYCRLPLDGPVRVPAGGRVGVLVHTSHARGVALRARPSGTWQAGDPSDGDGAVALRAGLLPCGADLYRAAAGADCLPESLFRQTFSPVHAAAFVGAVDYRFV
jgi:hypothetical protein